MCPSLWCAGDALDESVLDKSGVHVYGIDAVASMDNTVVYQIPRAALEKVYTAPSYSTS